MATFLQLQAILGVLVLMFFTTPEEQNVDIPGKSRQRFIDGILFQIKKAWYFWACLLKSYICCKNFLFQLFIPQEGMQYFLDMIFISIRMGFLKYNWSIWTFQLHDFLFLHLFIRRSVIEIWFELIHTEYMPLCLLVYIFPMSFSAQNATSSKAAANSSWLQMWKIP